MPIWTSWKSKPWPGTPLDRGNPLVQDLALLLPYWEGASPDGATLANLADPTAAVKVKGGSSFWSWTSSPDGVALQRLSASSLSEFLLLSRPVTLAAATSWTYLYRGSVDSLPGGIPGFWRSVGGGTFAIISGSAFPWLRVNGSDVLAPSSGTAYTLGAYATYVYRWIDGVEASWWVDGVKRQSATSAATAGADTFIELGYQSTNDEYIQGLRGLEAFWSRALGDDEIAGVSAAPWQLMVPQPAYRLMGAAAVIQDPVFPSACSVP